MGGREDGGEIPYIPSEWERFIRPPFLSFSFTKGDHGDGGTICENGKRHQVPFASSSEAEAGKESERKGGKKWRRKK